MSRNPEYQFVPTDTGELEAQMISTYEAEMGTTVRPASPERLMIAWFESGLLQQRMYINYTGNQNIPSRADGANLDALGELVYDTTRPQAQSAVCTERFYISEAQETAILIPAGNRVTDIGSTLIWETVEDVYVGIGDTYVDVQVRCQTPGTVGNGWAVGQINTFVDLYDYCLRCENITASDEGADVATDDEYYELMRASMDAYSTAGPMGAYIYHAKNVSTEIGDVAAIRPAITFEAELPLYTLGSSKYAFLGGDTLRPDTLTVSYNSTEAVSGEDYTVTYEDELLTIMIAADGALAAASSISTSIVKDAAGRVKIFVLMDDGTIATSEIKQAVLEACNERDKRPLTDYVTVDDPETVSYDINFKYYIPSDSSVSSAEIEAAVAAAVEEYKAWQSAKLGRDINPSYLVWLLRDTGIKRVELTAPVFTTLHDGRDGRTPQVAQTDEVTVTNGGYEDE